MRVGDGRARRIIFRAGSAYSCGSEMLYLKGMWMASVERVRRTQCLSIALWSMFFNEMVDV